MILLKIFNLGFLMLNLEAGDSGTILHLKKTFPLLKIRNISDKIKTFVIHQHSYKYCEFNFLNIFPWVLFLRKHCDLNLIKLLYCISVVLCEVMLVFTFTAI